MGPRAQLRGVCSGIVHAILDSPLVPLFAIGLVALGVLLASERQGKGGLRVVSKVVASSAFVAVGWLGPLRGQSPALLVGVCLAAIGDVCLLPRKSRGWFLAGLVSFLLAHVAYTVAFLRLPVSWLVLGVGAAVLTAPALWVLRWLWPHLPERMRLPVLAYVVAITVMVDCAIAAAWAGATFWVPIGAVLFYLSDLTVARHRFVDDGYVNRLVGLPLYYAAQFMLATLLTVGLR